MCYSKSRSINQSLEITMKTGPSFHVGFEPDNYLRLELEGDTRHDGSVKITVTIPARSEPAGPTKRSEERSRINMIADFNNRLGEAYLALKRGDDESAQCLLDEALDHIIDDNPLMGNIDHLEADLRSTIGRLLGAAVSLYEGSASDAEDLLNEVDLRGNFNAIYLKARSLEFQCCWPEVERLYSLMRKMYLSDNNANNRYYKFRYRWACLNETRFHDNGIGIMRDLAVETRDDACLISLFNMYRMHPELGAAQESDNELFRLFLDPTTLEENFIRHVRNARTSETHKYDEFFSVLTSWDISQVEPAK